MYVNVNVNVIMNVIMNVNMNVIMNVNVDTRCVFSTRAAARVAWRSSSRVAVTW